jgi:hypothetical protein
MCIRLVLLAVLALLPWQAGAQTIVGPPAPIGPALICQLGPGQTWDASGASSAVCMWSVAAEISGRDPNGDATGTSWLRPGWGYKSGATMFVVGNMIAFSFPIWAAMGADAITITGVIITGELIEVAGIFLLGEDALHAIKHKLAGAVDELRTRFRHWKARSAETWTALAFPLWN